MHWKENWGLLWRQGILRVHREREFGLGGKASSEYIEREFGLGGDA
jgi:hypothetical protein